MKILLVRLDGIGDALACTPLIAALRDAGHRVGVALTTRNAGIFAERAFTWTHVLERRPWPDHGHAERDVERTVREARAIGYDIALVASEEMDGYSIAKRTARRRVGFHNGWEKPLKSARIRTLVQRSLVRPASLERVREHEVITLFRLGAGLSPEREPTRDAARTVPLVLDPLGAAEPARRAAFARAVTSANLPWPPDEGYLAVQLTPKWRSLGLDPRALAELARRLRAIAYVRLLVSQTEANEMQSVGDALGLDADRIHATVFEGVEGMRAWKRTIADAAVLITPDTGAAHVAGMTGTACVDCFPAGRLTDRQIVRWAPWAAAHRALVGGDADAIVAAARDLFALRDTCARS